ncbi:MAG TPA: translation initiation factor IF-2 subunit gamma [Candidatus Saccharimonadales bacterium]|nr:translation initiation factor IF-2 subunit gamma [Candidatus Saccharimonadales bacterium]
MQKQSELNMGTLGHVDHGKTTLAYAISHVWTDIHSESIKRSMTIKLGYSDAVIRKCEAGGKATYTIEDKCKDGSESAPVRRISLLDAPGHETLMATAIAGSSIIDSALFVISSTEQVPMPQTREHLMIINALGISRVIIVQTKIDIVGKEMAKKNYEQIKAFIKGSTIEKAPIIPVMANKGINIDSLLEEIATMKLPERDTKSDPIMYVARSFDVNRPGTPIKDLVGGVIGGSIIRGEFKIGDEIEIRPGMNVSKDKGKKETYEPILTRITSLGAANEQLETAIAGGLIAVGTDADPALAKADGLVGQVAGKAGRLPPTVNEITMEYHSLERSDLPKQSFRQAEPLILGVGTGTAVGYIKATKKNKLEVTLNHAACIDKKAKISVMRNFSQRWRLAGYGTLV